MKFTWLGYSCFIFESTYPQKIIFNPTEEFINNCDFDSEMIILFPSSNVYTKIPNDTLKKCTLINSLTSYSDEKIMIKSYESYKDDLMGLKRGENYIYELQFMKYKIVHLGSIGCIPDETIIDNLKNADILFIPVGGNICLDAQKANKLINLLTPKYIVPMNYRYSTNNFYLDGLHDFITTQKNAFKINSSTIHMSDLHNYEIGSTIILDPY